MQKILSFQLQQLPGMIQLCGLTLIAITLSACGGQPTASSEAVVTPLKPSHDAHHAHSHGHHGESNYQKPGADFQFMDTAVRTVEPFTEQAVSLALAHGYTAGEANISLTLSEGLTLVQGEPDNPYLLAAREPLALDISIIANSAGRHYITARVQVQQANREPISRVIAIALQAGKEQRESEQSKSANPSGDGLQALPAQERIY